MRDSGADERTQARPTRARPTRARRHVARRARTVTASVSAAAFLVLGGAMALVAKGTPATATTNGTGATATTPSTQFVDPFAPIERGGGFGQWGASPGASTIGGTAGTAHTATHGS
jgi:hypothetical protein